VSQELTRKDLDEACAVVGCQLHQLKAVIEVEAAGNGFDQSGRPKVLFEPHLFTRELKKRGYSAEIIAHAEAAGIGSARWNKALYPKTADGRWDQIAKACEIDQEAGLASASYGMGQVLGSNYKMCGFNSITEFVQAMSQGEGQQVLAMVAFIMKRKLDDEIQREDWADFAAGYNGPSYAANAYDEKLERAATKHLADPEAFWRGKPNHGYAAGELHSLPEGTDHSPEA